MKKRIFRSFGGIPGELVGRHEDGECCKKCIYIRLNCNASGAGDACEVNGRFIAVDPNDKDFLLARLKGEA